MSYKGDKGPKGPPGAIGIPYGRLESAIEFAKVHFGVKKEKILLGFTKTPPDVNEFDVYIHYDGGGAEFWINEHDLWVNWSYPGRKLWISPEHLDDA